MIPETAKAPHDPLLTVSVATLTLAASELVVLLVPATLAVLKGRHVQADMVVHVDIGPPDILFIAALLLMEFTIGFFYHYVLPFAREPLWCHVTSLLLAIYFFVTNLAVMYTAMLPYRFFFVAGAIAILVVKNGALTKRFAGTGYGTQTRYWYENIRGTLVVILPAATIFAVLVHPTTQPRVVDAVAGWTGYRLTPAFFTLLVAEFNLFFLGTSVSSLQRNYRNFVQFGRSWHGHRQHRRRAWPPPVRSTAPERFIGLLRLIRLTTTAVTLVLTASIASSLGVDGAVAWLTGFALAAALASSFALNDVADCRIDAINVPTRPIPSGTLSPATGVLVAVGCAIAAIVAAAATERRAIVILTTAIMVVLTVYSFGLKRIVGLKNLTMAAIGACLPLAAALAAGSVTEKILALAAAIALFVLQKEIAADVYDRPGDERCGIRTLAVVLGVRPAMAIVGATNAGLLVVLLGWMPSLAAIAAVNVVFAIVVALREQYERRYLDLQKVILAGGVLLAYAF